MKNKRWMVLTGVVIFFTACGHAQTIVTHEKEKFFHKDGQVRKFEGQFEYTYFLDSEHNKLTRTRVYDTQNKEIKPDNTVYTINPSLHSHPLNAATYNLAPVITAVGQPGEDAYELLLIKGDSVESSVVEGDTLIVSHSERLS